jgi:hypothetical protein
MWRPSLIGEQRLLRLNTPAQGAETALSLLPESASSALAAVNWHNVLLYGGGAILIIGAARFAMRKLFGNG